MKKRKIIIIGVCVCLLATTGLVYYLAHHNKNSFYKPNGTTKYDVVVMPEENDPYYQIGFADYVFIGTVIKENNRYLNENSFPRTSYQIKVTENLKGTLKENIEIIYPGGYDLDGTLILYKGNYITDESLLEVNGTYIFVGNAQPNGKILLQTLYTDTIYTDESKEIYSEYITNQKNVERERFKSNFEK